MTEPATQSATQSSAQPAAPHPRPLRADASRNRARIVDAARLAFVEAGPDVPLDEIARRAGVGNATVYRHFHDRRDLIRQVALESMERIAAEAEAALAEETEPFEALRRFVLSAAEERIGALCPLLTGSADGADSADSADSADRADRADRADGFAGCGEITPTRERLGAAVEAVMDRARRAGALRTDVAAGDLMVALVQLTRPLPGNQCVDFDRFAQRHLRLFLDGLHAPGRSELPGEPATLTDLAGGSGPYEERQGPAM